MSEEIKNAVTEGGSAKTEVIHSPFAADEEEPYIFISYAHKDRERVFPIIKELYEMGWRIWYDEGLEIGGNYYDCLANHIVGSAVVVLFLTENAVKSSFVTDNEIEYARSKGKKIIIYELEEGVALPVGVELATASSPRCTAENIEAELERIDGLVRGEQRIAKGITIHEKNQLVDTTAVGEYEFIAVPGGIALTKYLGKDTEVTVPAEYNGQKVVELRKTFYENKNIVSITIPGSVTSIGYKAFYGCSSLTSVTTPASVTSIGRSAFSACSSLTNITIPASVTSIDLLAFDNLFSSLTIRCAENTAAHKYAREHKIKFEFDESLNTVKAPASCPSETKISSAKEAADDANAAYAYFSYSPDMKDTVDAIIAPLREKGCIIRTPEDGDENKRISMLTKCACFVAFLSGDFIAYRMIDQVETASKMRTPFAMYELEECSISNEIELNFSCLERIKYDKLPEDKEAKLYGFLEKHNCVKAQSMPFEYKNDENGITIVKWISKGDTAVIQSHYNGIPVTCIFDMAFSGCSNLESITIPASVTSIGNGAFSFCSSLTSITIPDGVTSIGDRAFNECRSLTSITIPDSVTSIGDWVFNGSCSLRSINVSSNNSNYCSINGVLFNKSCDTIIAYPNAYSSIYTIPASVTSVGKGTFDGCRSLTSITIPASVTSIGEEAFRGCSSLTSITIPASVTSIGDSAFSNCSSLASINVDSNSHNYCSINGVLFNKSCDTIIAYQNAYSSTYTIPTSVVSIGNWAFRSCRLDSIMIPASVTSIGKGTFAECFGLTDITIPDSVVSIGDWAFRSCMGLKSITIPASVTSIGSSAFWGCISLTSITIPSSVTNIGDWVFDNSRFLTVYCSPDSYAWKYCEEKGISHKPLEESPQEEKTSAEQTAVEEAPDVATSSDSPVDIEPPKTAVKAEIPAEAASESTAHRSPLPWLIPLILVLLLGAGAAVQFLGIFDIFDAIRKIIEML